MNDELHDSRDAADDLVQRARSDRGALGELYDRYYPSVLRYCLRRLLERSAAEDVTSEVFLKVAQNLRGFAGKRETDFRRWLFRIATNALRAHLRQASRRHARLMAAAREDRLNRPIDPCALPSGEDVLDWSTIHEALLDLDVHQQAIVSLRFFAGLTHDEIAEVVGSTSGAVRTSLSRTLARLRKRFDPPRHRDEDQ